MNIYAAPVEVANAALAEVGHTQISSLLEGSPAAITFNAVYEKIVAKELTKHAWSFATRTERLTYQGETGNSPRYAYYLPTGILTPRSLKVGRSPARGYELRSNKLLTDFQRNYDLRHTFRASEDQWAADFAEGIRKRMMAVFYRALPVDLPAAREMNAEAELELLRARTRDRNAQPGVEMSVDPVLVRAWRGASTDAQA